MVEEHFNANHDHDRTFQPDLEDLPPSESEEVRSEVDKVDSVESTLGARIVARAWCDQKFKETLLVDATNKL